MPGRLPSLRGLAALSALARHGRHGPAASALGITRSALSHRIADLEDELGTVLALSNSRGSALTDDGEALLAAMGDALERIEAAVTPFRRRRGQLRVSTVDTFASNWLLPRLAAFRAAHPAIELSVFSSRRVVELGDEDMDCAIRHGSGDWPGLVVHPLFRETLLPVALPGAVRSGSSGWSVIAARSRFADWDEWWRGAGQAGAVPAPSLVVENRAQALEAALAGAGVALTDGRYVSAHLAAGRLEQLGPVVPRHEGYYFVHAPRVRNPRHVEAFARWLAGEARDESPPAAQT